MTTLYLQDSGEYVPATKDDVLLCAQALLAARFRRGEPVLNTPTLVKEFLALRLKDLQHEVRRHLPVRPAPVIAYENLFRGTLDHVVIQ